MQKREKRAIEPGEDYKEGRGLGPRLGMRRQSNTKVGSWDRGRNRENCRGENRREKK